MTNSSRHILKKITLQLLMGLGLVGFGAWIAGQQSSATAHHVKTTAPPASAKATATHPLSDSATLYQGPVDESPFDPAAKIQGIQASAGKRLTAQAPNTAKPRSSTAHSLDLNSNAPITLTVAGKTAVGEENSIANAAPDIVIKSVRTGIRRIDQTNRQATKNTDQDAYVDTLIDPNVPADDFKSLSRTNTGSALLGNLDHSIQALALYRNDGNYFDGTLDYGVHYIGRISTLNWGQIRLNAIALNEYSDYSGPQGLNSSYYQPNSGISRFSIEQYGLPLTDSLSMDNIWGTHRQVRYNPYRDRPSLVNSRFGAAEPDIRGLSTNLRFGRSSISLSGGDIGRTQGAVLPGFREAAGSVRRGQFTHTRERNAISGEVWRTNDMQAVDDRRGYRLGYDRLVGKNTTLSLTTVGSGDRRAHLLGGSSISEFNRHDFGAYWFDEDLVWLNTKIGDDNVGAFYRYTGRRGTVNWGSSIELRRDGLSGNSENQRDTTFLAANLSKRLNRRANLSGTYGYRQVRSKFVRQQSYAEHSLRTFYTLTHARSARSSLGLHMRHRGSDSEIDLNYGWSKDLPADSMAELESGYRVAQLDGSQTQELRIAARWSKQFLSGQYLSLGLGYNAGTSSFDDSRGFTGYLNFDSPITDKLAVSLQLDYSRNQSEYQDQDLSGNLFTSNQFDEENLNSSREFSALLKLSYRLNGQSNQRALSSRRGAQGAGGVRGIVFIDKNNDGVRQANEAGVKGINVFLNSVYPAVTDSNGEYRFAAVGIGEHFIMIDETNLPLPWSLSKGEYTPVSVGLRRTTIVDIPLSTITLAEAD